MRSARTRPTRTRTRSSARTARGCGLSGRHWPTASPSRTAPLPPVHGSGGRATGRRTRLGDVAAPVGASGRRRARRVPGGEFTPEPRPLPAVRLRGPRRTGSRGGRPTAVADVAPTALMTTPPLPPPQGRTSMTTKDTNGARRPPTLVFVHGTNSSSHLCSALITELTLRGHRCVAVDLPGHGAEAFYPARTRPRRTSRGWQPSRHRSPRSPSTTTSRASWTWCAAPAATGP